MKKFIPDFLTCLNLFCGCIALVFLFNGNFQGASGMIFLALLFDFLDGMAARVLGVSSPIGVQLDSLADMVSFGVVPGMMLYEMMKYSLGNSDTEYSIPFTLFMLMVPFSVTICSALRLAKFNIDENQKTGFIGLPTPASALVVASFPLIKSLDQNFLSLVIEEPAVIAITSCMLSFLMISSLKMFSLKFQNFSFGQNFIRYLFIFISAILIFLFHFSAMPMIIFLYIFLSFAQNLFFRQP